MKRSIALVTVLAGIAAILVYQGIRDEDAPFAPAMQANVPPTSMDLPPAEASLPPQDHGPETAPLPEIREEVVSAASLGDLESWRRKAMERLATTSPNGDLGHDAVLRMMRQFMDNGCRMQNAGGAGLAAADLAASDRYNPTGKQLTQEEVQQLQSVLDEHNRKTQDAKSCEYLSSLIGLSEAIQGGHFMEFPTPRSEKEEADNMAACRAAAKFHDKIEFNISAVPGSNSATYRLIALKAATSPDYIREKRHLRDLEALHEIAVRSFFVPVGGGR